MYIKCSSHLLYTSKFRKQIEITATEIDDDDKKKERSP